MHLRERPKPPRKGPRDKSHVHDSQAMLMNMGRRIGEGRDDPATGGLWRAEDEYRRLLGKPPDRGTRHTERDVWAMEIRTARQRLEELKGKYRPDVVSEVEATFDARDALLQEMLKRRSK
jgi:hypothetical protein